VRILHDRQIARHFQGQFVARFSLCLCKRLRRLQDVIWNASRLRVRDEHGPGIGGIEHMFTEQLADFCLTLLDGGEAFFGSTGQLCTRQHKVAQRQGSGMVLFRVQTVRANGFVLGVKRFVGTQASPKLGDLGKLGVVGCPKFWRVGHRLQVAHCTPSAAQLFGGGIEHFGNVYPVGRKVVLCHLGKGHICFL